MTASDRDREYMRRLGAYKELSHREAQALHLAASLDERFRRSWRLHRRYRRRAGRDDTKDDPSPFYERARELDLYQP